MLYTIERDFIKEGDWVAAGDDFQGFVLELGEINGDEVALVYIVHPKGHRGSKFYIKTESLAKIPELKLTDYNSGELSNLIDVSLMEGNEEEFLRLSTLYNMALKAEKRKKNRRKRKRRD